MKKKNVATIHELINYWSSKLKELTNHKQPLHVLNKIHLLLNLILIPSLYTGRMSI